MGDIINNVRIKFHQWYLNFNATGYVDNQKLFYFLKDRKRNTRLFSLYMETINKLNRNSFVIKDIHFSGSMTYRKCCFRLHVKKRQISCVVPKLMFVAHKDSLLFTMRNRHRVLTWSEHNNLVLKVLYRTAGHVYTIGYVIVVVFRYKFQRHKFQSV